ncbi:MAG: type VI secretion system protein TssA, partial [Candidatus Binataceae bacterium]
RYTGAYDQIQEARRADDNLNQGEWKRDIKIADWRMATSLATDALATRTKDIQIAAWLTEALTKQNGFAGARDGFRLLHGLHERFWDTLYPRPEDGDMEVRAGALEWLNDRLPSSLAELGLTLPTAAGEAYSFLRFKESRAVDELGRKNQEAAKKAIDEGKITGEQFDKQVAASPRKFYESLLEDLSEGFAECEKLAAIVDEKFGRDAPSLLGIKRALDDCRGVVEPIVKKKRELEPDPVAPAAGNEDGAVTVSSAPAPTLRTAAPAANNGGVVPLDPVDRADALKRLDAIAAFFHRTEPHSPVSYLVQRAVRWGQMPLEQWLTDVINDENVLARIRETLGIDKTEKES